MTAERRASPERIVAAAATLLRERGAEALTTRAVAEAAGVQPPAIYRLFGDKHGLIKAVADTVLSTYLDSKIGAGHNDRTDPVSALRASWQLHIDFGLDNPNLYQLMTGRPGDPNSEWIDQGADMLRSQVRRLADAGLLQVSEERAVNMIHATGHGVVLTLLDQAADDRDTDLSIAVFEAVLDAIVVQPDAIARPADDALGATIAFTNIYAEFSALSEPEKTLLGEWLRRIARSLT